MRVLFLSTWFPYPQDSGAKLRAYYLLRALMRAHKVTLVSFAFDTARPDEVEGIGLFGMDVHTIPIDPFVENKASMLRTFLSLRPMASRPIPAMQRVVDRVLGADQFDVVIASTAMMADYVIRAQPNLPKILEEHNSMARWMRDQYIAHTNPVQQMRRWVSWQKARYHEARLFDRFDLVTMVSEQDRAAALDLPGYHKNVVLVPNGVDCAHNSPDLARVRPKTLVYNGALTYSANYDAMRWFLAEIYPKIKTCIPDVSLTITGSQKGADLAALALDDSVQLTGFVEDVRFPVAQAEVCVVPIRQGSGTRLKILEAMALGTPVVATVKGAEGLDVIDNEHLLLADTPEAFADAVLRVMNDTDLRQRLQRNARLFVEQRYNWETIGAQFVALVEDTVKA